MATHDASSLTHKRVIIVGAGQAGLAMGYALLRRGLEPQKDFVLIDSSQRDARTWKSRWHSLTLFTSARYSSLPGVQFPGDPQRYPRADEVATYLEDYADQLGFRPIWGTRALGVSSTPGSQSLTLHTSDGDFETRNVVAATGAFGLPRLPAFAKGTAVPGLNIHSSEYTHPNQVPPGKVLIVGAGNTGRQLARELSHSHDVTLACGSPVRELPQRFLGLDLFAWLTRSGLLSLPLPARLRSALAPREVAIGNSLEDLRGLGIRTVGRVTGSDGGRFQMNGGSAVVPDSVIWATGFESGFGWLPNDVRGPDTRVHQRRGATTISGLYVIGMPWMRSRGSALIAGVGSDASHIAKLIEDRP